MLSQEVDPIKQFVSKLRSLRKSKETINSYKLTMRLFRKWLEDNNKNLMAATKDDVNEFRDHLSGLLDEESGKYKYKGTTINRHIRAINTFWELVRSERLGARGVKTTKHPPDWLTDKQIIALSNTAAVKGLEYEVWVRLMYELALRVSESIYIKVQDIDFDKAEVRLYAAKGSGEEYEVQKLEIDRLYVKKLKQWLEERPKETTFLFPSFVSSSGRPSRQKAWRILKSIANDSGIPKEKVWPHVLRHSKAVHLRLAGVSLEDIKDFLRHERLETVLIYATITLEELTKKLSDVKSPLD